jgi:hypothetical protein
MMLQKRLARLGFEDWQALPPSEVLSGELWPFAHIIRFVFHQSLLATACLLRSNSWFVVEKEDGPLADAFLKLLRESFAYNASLNPAQFKKKQFGSKKIIICCDFIVLMSRLEAQLALKDDAKRNKKGIIMIHQEQRRRAEQQQHEQQQRVLLPQKGGVMEQTQHRAEVVGCCGQDAQQPMRAVGGGGHVRCRRRDPVICEKMAAIAEDLRRLDLRRRALNRVLRHPTHETDVEYLS